QLVESPPRRFPLRIERVELGLDMKCLDERIRIEEQLQNRTEQPPDEPERPAMRLEQRLLAERKIRRRGRRAGGLCAAIRFEQIGTDAFRIEEFLELDGGELADLLFRIVDAALLANARADLLHDLLDVYAVGADIQIRTIHRRSPRRP